MEKKIQSVFQSEPSEPSRLYIQRSGPLPRRSQWLAGGPPGRSLVLEDDAEELPAQPVGQPRVLDDGHLEALAAQHGVVVGVDGSAHPLDDHQVGLALPHHHRQHLVQAASGKESEQTVKKTHRRPRLLGLNTHGKQKINSVL